MLGAARMVFYQCADSRRGLLFSGAVLALPLFVPAFLADAVNLQVEEGFAFAFLACAFTLVAIGPPAGTRALLGYTISIAAALDLLYLSKSSMILVVVLFLGFGLLHNVAAWSRVLLLLLVMAAPIGWAMRQHAVSVKICRGYKPGRRQLP